MPRIHKFQDSGHLPHRKLYPFESNEEIDYPHDGPNRILNHSILVLSPLRHKKACNYLISQYLFKHGVHFRKYIHFKNLALRKEIPSLKFCIYSIISRSFFTRKEPQKLYLDLHSSQAILSIHFQSFLFRAYIDFNIKVNP